MQPLHLELAPLFEAVGRVLESEREALNQADTENGNHGDHMVVIFQTATHVAQTRPETPMAEVMLEAGRQLESLAENGSAQVYALGLICMAEQLEKHKVDLPDLARYMQSALDREADKRPTEESSSRSGKVLKALAAGLAEWSRAAESAEKSSSSDTSSEKAPPGKALSLGVLFEFGMAYLQAKQRGGDRVSVLADAAVSVSPLGNVSHRSQSGKLAIEALLHAILAQSTA